MNCEKRTYGSAKAAKASNGHARFRLHIYWCAECRGFHVSNADKCGHAPSQRDPHIDKLKKRERRQVWR